MHLEGLAHKFTIGGTIIAILLFIIALVEVYHFNQIDADTQKTTASLTMLLNKTDSLLTETQKSTAGLDVLINRTDQLILAQTSTSSNISQQTIMKEYSDEAPFQTDLSYCNYDANDNDIAYSTIILNKNGDPVTLKFMLTALFRYYTLPTDNGTQTTGEAGTLGNEPNPELVDPIEEKLHILQLLPTLNETQNSNNTYLFIRSEYYFAPYSEVTGKIITKYTHDGIGKQMIEFTKNARGNWELYPSPNSVCK
ncbi:MAG: hypothetical protein WA799_06000 [Nitrosotalea sp.]